MEKLKSQVKVTFWFWLMYPPPPRNGKVEISGQVTFWFWLMYPPPPRNGKVEISGQSEPPPPPHFQNHYLILCLNRKLVNFSLKWIWIYGLEPHPPPLSSQKNEMLIFGLHSTSDDRPSWSMDSNPVHHPLQPKKLNACFWITFNF